METQKKFPVSRMLLILLSLVSMALAQTAAALVGNGVLLVTHLPALGNAAAGVLYPILAMAGFWALCRFGLREPLSVWRMGPVRLKPVWCVTAVLMPALVCGTFLLLPGQWAVAADRVDTGSILVIGIFYLGIGTGIVEEAVFRGFIMTALERRWNRWAAVLLPSVLFGLVHIIGSDLDMLSIVQLVLAGTMVGVLFSLVALESGSIWNGALIHGVWNAATLFLHIGPETNAQSLINYLPETKDFLLTGGDFGMEASIISVAAYALFAGMALFLLRKGKKRAECGPA